MKGTIRWYCLSGDDGVITGADGNSYYFNSWSFPGTHWLATGVSKKTGKKITVNCGRKFPGLWVDRKEIKDWVCSMLKTNLPVSFKQASGIERPWAVEIEILETPSGLREWLGLANPISKR